LQGLGVEDGINFGQNERGPEGHAVYFRGSEAAWFLKYFTI
jgi:hypothetical protein